MTPVLHKSSWRIWLIGSYALIVVMVALLWAYSLFSPINQAEENQQYESLTSIAQASRVALANTNLSEQGVVSELANASESNADATNSLRVTLIDTDGTVLADSIDDPAQMENHSQRPEFEDAVKSGFGKDRRVSTSDGIEYLYVAVTASYQGTDTVLRVSTPVSEIDTMAQHVRNTGLILLALAVIVAVVVSWFAFTRTMKPVSHLERVRTDFVANASHEFKTPVAGIRLLSESISQAAAEGDLDMVRLFAERLDKESKRLQGLLTDLLDLSRLENNTKNRAHEATDFYSAVSTSYEGHIAEASSKGIEFVFDDKVPADERCMVRLSAADATLLVDNLVKNALTYTYEGRVTVRLSCDEKHVVLRVQDTGIGIAVQDQERIFERFYRADKARSREAGGTGLGLSLVRHAVNGAGGTISLTSTLGEGSIFTVSLPRISD